MTLFLFVRLVDFFSGWMCYDSHFFSSWHNLQMLHLVRHDFTFCSIYPLMFEFLLFFLRFPDVVREFRVIPLVLYFEWRKMIVPSFFLEGPLHVNPFLSIYIFNFILVNHVFCIAGYVQWTFGLLFQLQCLLISPSTHRVFVFCFLIMFPNIHYTQFQFCCWKSLTILKVSWLD